MPEAILSDYFYGDESEQFVFFKIPRQLITDPKFKHISTDAKSVYDALEERRQRQIKSQQKDAIFQRGRGPGR